MYINLHSDVSVNQMNFNRIAWSVSTLYTYIYKINKSKYTILSLFIYFSFFSSHFTLFLYLFLLLSILKGKGRGLQHSPPSHDHSMFVSLSLTHSPPSFQHFSFSLSKQSKCSSCRTIVKNKTTKVYEIQSKYMIVKSETLYVQLHIFFQFSVI